ncbi:hypothetical protein CC80DRAFT_550426 [Byssothecium circinans]|uniref:Uncharacterized protein n=1 Tax=Byssothecium circinans TaxID=147558 RepID=A0A6A5TQ85_9PLEO|nr:hypothetical protein CC80DRAFT_550426 [Byssothecium circinans]
MKFRIYKRVEDDIFPNWLLPSNSLWLYFPVLVYLFLSHRRHQSTAKPSRRKPDTHLTMHFPASIAVLTLVASLTHALPTRHHNISGLPYYRNTSTIRAVPSQVPNCTAMNPTVIQMYNATHMQFYNGTWLAHNRTNCTAQVPKPKMPVPVNITLTHTTTMAGTLTSSTSMRATGTQSASRQSAPHKPLHLPKVTNVPDLIRGADRPTKHTLRSSTSTGNATTTPDTPEEDEDEDGDEVPTKPLEGYTIFVVTFLSVVLVVTLISVVYPCKPGPH